MNYLYRHHDNIWFKAIKVAGATIPQKDFWEDPEVRNQQLLERSRMEFKALADMQSKLHGYPHIDVAEPVIRENHGLRSKELRAYGYEPVDLTDEKETLLLFHWLTHHGSVAEIQEICRRIG